MIATDSNPSQLCSIQNCESSSPQLTTLAGSANNRNVVKINTQNSHGVTCILLRLAKITKQKRNWPVMARRLGSACDPSWFDSNLALNWTSGEPLIRLLVQRLRTIRLFFDEHRCAPLHTQNVLESIWMFGKPDHYQSTWLFHLIKEFELVTACRHPNLRSIESPTVDFGPVQIFELHNFHDPNFSLSNILRVQHITNEFARYQIDGIFTGLWQQPHDIKS